MSQTMPTTAPATITAPAAPLAPPPTPLETLRQITTGWVLTRSLQVVADLGVADALGDAPQPAAALAAATGAHPQALERTLRLLASYGVFATDGGGVVSHTPASRLLRADHPQSLKALVRMFGLPVMRGASEHFAHALRTGRPAVEVTAPAGTRVPGDPTAVTAK